MKYIILFSMLMASSAFAFWNDSFSTRLSGKLAIGGFLCRGGEIVSYFEEQTTCKKGQWLVSVDNINVCSDRMCTEMAAPSFIADLERLDVITISEEALYEIHPVSKINPDVERILKKYLVKDSLNGPAKVIKRK